MDHHNGGVSAVILGTMQDGGLPHIGCACLRCSNAIGDPTRAMYAASLGITDRRSEPTAVWIVDATPDIKWQLAMLAGDLGPDARREDRLRQPDGLFLTHAHMGHIGGLAQLGSEAMAVWQLPVYAPPGLVTLLKETALWRPLLSRLSLVPGAEGETITLAPRLTITPLAVPHRDEWGAGTVAYRIDGPQRSLLYLPDIDDWDLWPAARRRLEEVDYALVDGSFYSVSELEGRAAVVHPPVPDTLQRFKDLPGQLIFTHINHTNPILDEDSIQRHAVIQAGAQIAWRGQMINL